MSGTDYAAPVAEWRVVDGHRIERRVESRWEVVWDARHKLLSSKHLCDLVAAANAALAAAGKPEPRTTSEVTDEMAICCAEIFRERHCLMESASDRFFGITIQVAKYALEAALAVGAATKEEG